MGRTKTPAAKLLTSSIRDPNCSEIYYIKSWK